MAAFDTVHGYQGDRQLATSWFAPGLKIDILGQALQLLLLIRRRFGKAWAGCQHTDQENRQ
jgi:hypothetical protein